MVNVNKRRSGLTYFLVSACMGLLSGNAAADLVIPKVPLQTGSDVPINLMFMLDDSGSMGFGYLPDTILGVCSNNTSQQDRARGRSPDYNKAYFNPNVTYVVPPKADGSIYPTPSLRSAYTDGFNQTGLVDLTQNFRPTWRPITSGRQYCGSNGAADYYLYDESQCWSKDIEDNRCYKRYVVSQQSAAIKQKLAIW